MLFKFLIILKIVICNSVCGTPCILHKVVLLNIVEEFRSILQIMFMLADNLFV